MDILILGGTGAMGSHVSGLLKARGIIYLSQAEVKEKMAMVSPTYREMQKN